eukprot:GHVS01098251.1.p2 GENE.GHVS01098251.1~~GHVS01098251.1.p2  ORF type:complete len:193 (-),score=14.01 GHVS01098251.1:79-657(-)
MEAYELSSLPVGSSRWTYVGSACSLDTESSRFAASGCETSQLSMLMHRPANPVDAGVISDAVVLRIHQNNLEKLVCGVLAYPIGVQHTQVTAYLAANSLLCYGTQILGRLLLFHTLPLGLSVYDALGDQLLSVTTTNTHSIDRVSLFGFVAKSPSFVWSSSSAATMDGGKLAILPGSHTHQEAHNIALLLLP